MKRSSANEGPHQSYRLPSTVPSCSEPSVVFLACSPSSFMQLLVVGRDVKYKKKTHSGCGISCSSSSNDRPRRMASATEVATGTPVTAKRAPTGATAMEGAAGASAIEVATGATAIQVAA